MRLIVEISAGELIDKLTILELKLDRIEDETKRANVAREYSILANTRAGKTRFNRQVRVRPAYENLHLD